MRFRIVGGLLALSLIAFVAPSCSAPKSLGFGEDIDVPSFSSSDAGEADASEDGGLITYCPSSACPPGWTTCPNSRFPCDTNVNVDSTNCGACGVVCPQGGGSESYVCVEGECTMKCTDHAFDCDGLPDNGCEARASSRESCGGCGIKCEDPDKPCVRETNSSPYECGCPWGKTACGGRCVDVQSDERNCSACGVACDPTGPGLPERPNAIYGCTNGECGRMKCKPGFANCDGDPENGCETSTKTKDNCGVCGRACTGDKECRIFGPNRVPTCLCEPGFTQCGPPCPEGSICDAQCADLTSDRANCGACGVACNANIPNAFGSCNYGACTYGCNLGWADCNDSGGDGCETNTKNDPNNCGGCGITCDLLLGQACVAGRCVVEPCSDLERDAGDIAR